MNGAVTAGVGSSNHEASAGGGVAVLGVRKPAIPDFVLIRQIGRGSYGDVWLARSLTGVYRAIKVVFRDRFADSAPFEREFRGLNRITAISLTESGQLALLHVGQSEADGFFYYVMELADDVHTGRDVDPERYRPLTLREVRSRRGRLPADECVTVGVELARAIAGLHSRGLVHRDIKPSNVVMVGGTPKLADIGLVAPSSDARTFVGTEGYAPPEGPGKPSADVFALGKLLYELATGLETQDYPRLSEELRTLPDRKLILELNEVIVRACEPSESLRYPDAAAMLTELLELQAGHSLRPKRFRARSGRLAVISALVLAAAAVGHWWVERTSTSAEARRLVAEAWEHVNKVEMGRPEGLELADGLCKRASELDPMNADVWAAWSQVNTLYSGNAYYYESAAHREAARSDAARALKLAPDSFEARLAQACYLARLDPATYLKMGISTFAPEADRLLRQLLREKPDEPRALRLYALLQGNLGNVDRARVAMTQLARNPQFAAIAWLHLARLARKKDDMAACKAALDRSIAIQPYSVNLSDEILMLVEWEGDLGSAEAVFKKIPASIAQSDYLVPAVYSLYEARREPDTLLNYLHSIPHDWVAASDAGPMGLFAGNAQALAGRMEMARIEWAEALKVTERRLAEQPTSRHLVAVKSRLLVQLGEFAGAEKNLQLGEEAGWGKDWVGLFYLRLAQGDQDAAMDILEQELVKVVYPNAAQLRLNPKFDRLKANNRFRALLARFEADPKRSPSAPSIARLASAQH